MPTRKRLGAYTAETNVSNEKRTAKTRMGGIRSAAYHRAGSRHRDMREKRSHIPSSPSTILVRMMPARHGPRSIAGQLRQRLAAHEMRCGYRESAYPGDRERQHKVAGDWMASDEGFMGP